LDKCCTGVESIVSGVASSPSFSALTYYSC
jgi:hypothetical protein